MGLTILRQIDQFLRMFHPQAHSKGLRFHGNAPPKQHFKGITGAVAHSKHHLASLYSFPVRTDDALNAVSFQNEIRHTGAKPHFASPCKDLLPHILYHL